MLWRGKLEIESLEHPRRSEEWGVYHPPEHPAHQGVYHPPEHPAHHQTATIPMAPRQQQRRTPQGVGEDDVGEKRCIGILWVYGIDNNNGHLVVWLWRSSSCLRLMVGATTRHPATDNRWDASTSDRKQCNVSNYPETSRYSYDCNGLNGRICAGFVCVLSVEGWQWVGLGLEQR